MRVNPSSMNHTSSCTEKHQQGLGKNIKYEITSLSMCRALLPKKKSGASRMVVKETTNTVVKMIDTLEILNHKKPQY